MTSPLRDYVATVIPWNGPFSTEHAHRLQQLRYATRFKIGDTRHVSFHTPDRDAPIEATLVAIAERDSFDEPEPP